MLLGTRSCRRRGHACYAPAHPKTQQGPGTGKTEVREGLERSRPGEEGILGEIAEAVTPALPGGDQIL